MHPQQIKLETLGEGLLNELFQEELARVVENLRDINTSPTAERVITVRLGFRPADATRKEWHVSLLCEAKLPKPAPVETRVVVGIHEGALVAVEVQQQQMFNEERTAPRAVNDNQGGA